MNFWSNIKSTGVASIAALSLVTGAHAFAKSELPPGSKLIPLAEISNDRDQSISFLNLVVNKQDRVAGVFLITKVPGKDTKGGSFRTVSKINYSLSKIESKEGVVLGQGQGVKAILLQGRINSPAGRGNLKIEYLSNGLLMRYNHCNVDLRRLHFDDWRLINAYNGKPIKRINVKTWFLGISTLQHVCPVNLS